MAVIRIQDFSGAVPVKGDRALPDGFAVESVNTWLYGSELRGIRPPALLTPPSPVLPSTRKIMRMPKRTAGNLPSDLVDSVWAQFDDPDTDIVKGQLIEDQYERWYACSPATGPVYNTHARILSASPWMRLGVPGPAINTTGTNADTPTLAITGGVSTNILTRSYLYTWVNTYGEESAPSLPVTGSGKSDAVWTISNIKDPPDLTGQSPPYAPYTKKRIYRTVTGASGQTTYYRVVEMLLPPLNVLAYADDTAVLTDAKIVNNLTLQSTSWQPPPVDLQGWIAMPNGFLIGFDKADPAGGGGGNNLYFCDSYHFHAWPPEWKQATETPIVGLGVLGQTCVVCTQGYPATVTGSKPSTCAFTKATTGEPCLARGGIVSTPDGVIYPSQNGLIVVGPGGINNVTQSIITRDEWIKAFTPQRIRAVRYQNGYLALQAIGTPNNKGFFLDPTALKVALTELSEFDSVVNIMTDVWSGEVLMIKGSNLYRWDPPTTDMWPVRWKSKEFQYPFKENFGAYAIYWDALRVGTTTDGPDVCPLTDQVHLKVWANRTLRYDMKVPVNGQAIKLPSGFKADIWQFEIAARAPVYSLHVASTTKELKAV